MSKEKIINVPNALSLYRIVVFPLVVFFIISGNELLFSVFLCINLVTDFLDGIIARTFKLVTKIGARLDSLGDYGTYILAILGLLKFKAEDLATHGWILYLFIFFLILTQVVHFIRFKTFSSFHLYSFKTTGYLHAVLFLLWFFVEFIPVYYYFAMGFGILAEVETLVVLFLLKERRSNAKGVYWLLKENK